MNAYFAMAKTSSWTSNFSVRSAKNAMTRKKEHCWSTFCHAKCNFYNALYKLDCLGRQALQNLHVIAKNCNDTSKTRELYLFLTVKLLEDTRAVLSLGKLCEDHVYSTRGPVVRNHNSSKMARRIKCSTENYVAIVVPGLSTGSSSSATLRSPTSVPQEAVTPASHPASTRSESTSSTV